MIAPAASARAVESAQCTPSRCRAPHSGPTHQPQLPPCRTITANIDEGVTEAPYAYKRGGIEHPWNKSPPPVNGPADGGFDCSGLTTAAYRAAGITLPRTADTQFRAGPRVPTGQPPLPGDLVFYGDPNTKIRHAGLYIGGGLMIDAPDFGQVVQIEPHRYRGDDYAGATRPAN